MSLRSPVTLFRFPGRRPRAFLLAILRPQTVRSVRAGFHTSLIEPFRLLKRPETLVHVLRAEGTWANLRTLDAESAFYDLTATYMDEILEGIIVRNILQDTERIQERTPNKQNEDNPISFRKGPVRIRLPVGNYTLRSTFNLFATYRDADWELDLLDGVFGPQGIGSVDADMQGFESQVGPRNRIPEPSTMALLAIGIGGVIGRAWRRQRR